MTITIKEAIDTINTWIVPMRKTFTSGFMREFFDAIDTLKNDIINKEKYCWHDLRKHPNDLPNKDTMNYTGIANYSKGEQNKISERVMVLFDNGFTMCGHFMGSCRKPYHWEFGERYRSDPTQWICGIGTERCEHIIKWRYIESIDDEEC